MIRYVKISLSDRINGPLRKVIMRHVIIEPDSDYCIHGCGLKTKLNFCLLANRELNFTISGYERSKRCLNNVKAEYIDACSDGRKRCDHFNQTTSQLAFCSKSDISMTLIRIKKQNETHDHVFYMAPKFCFLKQGTTTNQPHEKPLPCPCGDKIAAIGKFEGGEFVDIKVGCLGDCVYGNHGYVGAIVGEKPNVEPTLPCPCGGVVKTIGLDYGDYSEDIMVSCAGDCFYAHHFMPFREWQALDRSKPIPSKCPFGHDGVFIGEIPNIKPFCNIQGCEFELPVSLEKWMDK